MEVTSPTKMLLTLALVYRDGQVLLGMKKRGFGQGRWNGFGGKVQDGESIQDASIRELREESGINATTLHEVAIITFTFEDTDVSREVHVFNVTAFTGEPAESDEMLPRWFELNQVPYSQMWQADTYWMPKVIEGNKITAAFHYSAEHSLLHYKINPA